MFQGLALKMISTRRFLARLSSEGLPSRMLGSLGLVSPNPWACRVMFVPVSVPWRVCCTACARLSDSASHPQWALRAFRDFQIPQDLCDGYGYPQLTDQAKRKILGENLLRLHGLGPVQGR